MKSPKNPLRIAGIAALLFLAVAAITGGAFVLMQPKYGGVANAATSVPDPGKVRVLATPLESGADKIVAEWTFLGGANWNRATATGTDFALVETTPLNEVGRSGGCNTYYARLDADAATGKWTMTLHGSNGSTAQSGGDLPPGKSVAELVKIEQSAPMSVVGTPAQIVLARVGNVPVRVSLAR